MNFLKSNKIITISVTVGFIFIVILFIAFSGNTQNKTILINFIDNGSEILINENDVRKIILDMYPNFENETDDVLDLSEIENVIEQNPSVKRAEAYKKYGGVLAVDIEQRIPLIRIFPKNGKSFYIDTDGAMLPLSKLRSARVIVANGNIKYNYKSKQESIFDDTLKNAKLINLYKLAKYINNDQFLKAQTEQLYVNSENEYELIPKVGRHTVLLGGTENFEKKLKYLKHFYLNILNKEGWNKYTHINLKYNGQIVCTNK